MKNNTPTPQKAYGRLREAQRRKSRRQTEKKLNKGKSERLEANINKEEVEAERLESKQPNLKTKTTQRVKNQNTQTGERETRRQRGKK